MLDHLCINIPFDSKYYEVSANGAYTLVNTDLFDTDLFLASRAVYKDDEGNVKVGHLYHPYETLPTHYTGMALKVFFDGNGKIQEPYVQIKASPAKLLQGHNVFGSDDIENGAMEMLGYLQQSYPQLTQMLDITKAWVSHIDVTYSAKTDSNTTAQKVLDYLRNVSNGHTRLSKKSFDTSVYWGGATSRLINIKCYLKHDEFMSQYADMQKKAKANDKSAMRTLQVMQNPKLMNWLVGLVRLEARLKKRWLERKNIPTNLFALIMYQKKNPDLLKNLWKTATSSLMQALQGHKVKMNDDREIIKAIENSPVVLNAKGKVSQTKVRNLLAMFVLIRDKGFDEVKNNYGRSQFYKLVKDLSLCGFSKASLQNIHAQKDDGIIHLVKVLEIDFNQQLPDWYVEPISQFNYQQVA